MKRLFLTIFLMAFAFTLKAAYLENVPVTVTQPDGIKLDCFATGDEFYNYLHDEHGFTIIQDHSNGFYVYADVKDGELVPTTLVAGRSNPASQLRPYLNISPEKRMEKHKAWDVPEHLRKPETKTGNNNHGTLNNIVIFIRFADDSEFTNSFSSVNNMFNANESGVSMQSYFDEVSYHQINIPTTFYPAPNGNSIVSYQDTQNRSYFQPYDSRTNPNGYNGDNERTEREHALLERAVNYITANNMIPSDLNVDYDNDGYVDNVCFVVRGNVGAWSDLLWPHQWSLYTREVRINGKIVYTFNFQLADAVNNFNTSTMCHEMNHSLGAPDLYHYSYTGPTPVGKWDLMQSNATPPQHMGAYMKYRYGNWIDEIPEITEPGVYTLHDISSSTNNCYKIASPVSGQYYVLEYRKKSVEAAIPGTGLLIYRINTAEDGKGNMDWDGVNRFDEVYIFRPDGTPTVDGSINSAYFCSGSGRTAFDATTNPKPFLIDGTVDNDLMISEISAAGETISFKVGSSCDAPANLTVSMSGNEVTLTWDAVDGIDSYSVFRDGIAVGNTVTSTSFADELDAYGTHSYCVKSNCPNGGNSMASNSVEVNYAYPGPIATLTGDVDGNEVLLQWEEPLSRSVELYYGIPQSSLSTATSSYWAQVFEPSQLGNCFGMAVTGISFFAYNTNITYVLKIYNGDTPEDGNLLATKSFTPTKSWELMDVTLDQPAYVDCSKKLWVTFYCASNDAVVMVQYANDDYSKAILLSDDGVTYYVPDWLSGKTFSAGVKTHLSNGTYTYNISKDGIEIAKNQSGSSYSYTENDNGFHEYHLTTNYFGGESLPSNSVYVPAGATTQFLGTNSSDWSSEINWKNGLKPTPTDLVWARSVANLGDDVEINSLYISENVCVTVNNNATLTIADDAESRAGIEGLVIESGAALKTNASNLQGTARRVMTNAAKDEWSGSWHFLASPVADAPISDFTSLAINQDYDLYIYDEPSVKWFNEKLDNHSNNNDFYTSNGDTFRPGCGYLTSFGSNATMSFKGVFNAGEVCIPVSANSATSLKGFNLLGNPYPCAIDWDATSGWSREVLGTNPYFYVYDDAIGQYRIYSESTGGVPNGTTSIIAPCQGFFVKAASDGNVIINNEVKTTSVGPFRKGTDNDVIRIRVSGKNGSDEVLICENDELLPSAEKLFSVNELVPSLTLKHDDADFAIYVVDKKDSRQVIVMSFMAGKAGEFTISSGAEVELLDLRTGIVTDLSKSDYVFEAMVSDYADRFVLRLKGKEFVGEDNFVYQYGNDWVFRSTGRVQVIDLSGRVLIDTDLNGIRLDVSSLKVGVYVVRYFGDEVLTQKMLRK